MRRRDEESLRAEEECRREMERNRELLNQIERMQLSPGQRSTLQAKPVLAHTANTYSHNLSQSLVTRSPVAHQFHPPEVRQVAMDLSRDETSLGLAGGGSRRVDFVTVMSHLLVGAAAGSPRLPAGEAVGGRKRRRPGEQEEPQSPTYNRSRPHEATMMLPTTAPTGFLDILPVIPHEKLRENAIRRRRDPISGVEVRNVGPVVKMVVDRHMPRALGITDTGVAGVRPSNPEIRPIHMAHVPVPVRVEVATGAMMASIVTEDPCMAEHITRVSNLLASRCPAVYRSEMI